MANNPDLAPCPFCGSSNIDYGICTGTMAGFDYVQCQGCGAEVHSIQMPDGDNLAIRKWNTRVNISELPYGPEDEE